MHFSGKCRKELICDQLISSPMNMKFNIFTQLLKTKEKIMLKAALHPP